MTALQQRISRELSDVRSRTVDGTFVLSGVPEQKIDHRTHCIVCANPYEPTPEVFVRPTDDQTARRFECSGPQACSSVWRAEAASAERRDA